MPNTIGTIANRKKSDSDGEIVRRLESLLNRSISLIMTVIDRYKIKIKIFLSIIFLFFGVYLLLNGIKSPVQIVHDPQNHSRSDPRIYCFILTAPKYFDTRARAVNSTWAPRCDRYAFISEYSNDTKGLPIAPIPNITIGYAHLTRKSNLALRYIYENFANDYDWVVKADDDTYLFIDNLKSFLKEHNSSKPVTFGYNFKVCLPNDVVDLRLSSITCPLF